MTKLIVGKEIDVPPEYTVLQAREAARRTLRKTLEEHFKQLQALSRIEKQLSDLTKLVTYSLGQSTETQFRQSQQEKRIDELFEKLEELLNPKEPA